ncbi:GDSL-type esterase/lipase family protein [Streptomyces smyrnaeus]|uniref:GDSL-type esterase/lipase family protein n=1 Tax=Streptomyces smyrnaeus TaxID=1387713 RepID=UPI0027DC06FE|nr:GDSL-type esterase/lipase family protein [Streptomyces smyrnaeus]
MADVVGDWQHARPFVRGVSWWDGERCVRADPADAQRLPLELWARAAIPVGIRLEFTAPGPFEVRYRAGALGTVDALRDGCRAWEALRPDGERVALLPETPREEVRVLRVDWPGGPGVLHTPEAYAPVLLAVRGAEPAPPRPRWLVYGDSITEGWSATAPSRGWAALAGRELGWDTVNLGYTGSAHGEPATAQQLATLPGAALTVAFGCNCWTGVPCSAALMAQMTSAFLQLVRTGHPRTPLLVVSPLQRPEAEHTPNALGATLADLRSAQEGAVRARIAEGDDSLALLPGAGLVTAEQLVDGVHPDDTGHALVAAAVVRALREEFGVGRDDGARRREPERDGLGA